MEKNILSLLSSSAEFNIRAKVVWIKTAVRLLQRAVRTFNIHQHRNETPGTENDLGQVSIVHLDLFVLFGELVCGLAPG